jgi:DNA invertase Pin-like site-specific DNA recombinase
MRAVIYPRVSSLIQADRHTIASQLHDLPRYVGERGWHLARPVGAYVDDGLSAKTGTLKKRAGFQKLLGDLAQRPCPFDVLVVVDLKRITRTESWRERGEILGAIQDAGVKIAVASTGQLIDLNSSEGDLLALFGSYEAAADNRSRRESTMRGKLAAIREGRKPAGPTPFGLLYSRETRQWSHDPDLAPIVQEIFGRIIAGETCHDIAEDLKARKVLRVRPSKSGRRKPGKWIRERVWQIARNPVYRGEWTADKARGLTVAVPPIVTPKVWWAADRALSRFGNRGKPRTKRPYLLQDIAVCGVCGSLMGCHSVGKYNRGPGRTYYYWCRKRRRPGERHSCTMPMVRVDQADPRVWRAIVNLLSKPKYLEQALRKKQESAEEAGTWAKDREEAESKLKRHDSQCEKMAERYRRGLIADGVYDKHLEAAARERGLLARQVDAARAGADMNAQRSAQISNVLQQVASLRGKLAGANADTQREIARTLIPGSGGNVVTLHADGRISMKVMVAEAEPTRLPWFGVS